MLSVPSIKDMQYCVNEFVTSSLLRLLNAILKGQSDGIFKFLNKISFPESCDTFDRPRPKSGQ